jgi:menaquinone-dependent protoporphyrinogen oxidase
MGYNAGGRAEMKVLIVHASRYGSTAEVAESIGDTLREGGHDVVVWAAREMPSPRSYDVVVAGSAVHVGRALGELQRYFAKHKTDLAAKRVALFAVAGNLRDNTEENRRQAEAALRPLSEGLTCIAVGAFAGVVDLRKMPFLFRFLMRSAKVRSGDYRKWDEIRAWAADLSNRLVE